MVLARDAGRRVVPRAGCRWPRALRGKWLGLALLVVVLFAYELFDLWELPRADGVARARLLRRGAGRST